MFSSCVNYIDRPHHRHPQDRSVQIAERLTTHITAFRSLPSKGFATMMDRLAKAAALSIVYPCDAHLVPFGVNIPCNSLSRVQRLDWMNSSCHDQRLVRAIVLGFQQIAPAINWRCFREGAALATAGSTPHKWPFCAHLVIYFNFGLARDVLCDRRNRFRLGHCLVVALR